MGKITKIPARISRFTSAPIDSPVKRKVAAYARVSTDSEEQLTSYEAQVSYYSEYIKSRSDWEFIKVYTDEGITGCNTKKREGFKQMVDDALAGKINLIITKSVSRFARNTVDSLMTIRTLKEHNIEVYFEKENIWSFDSKCDLVLSIMSSIAQEESRSISENVTWGHRKRMADGKVSVPYSSFLGYDKGEDGKLVINPEQAETVRLIYALFIEGMTPHSIAKELTRRGIKTVKGRDVWNARTVSGVLTNEKYKGDALLQKTFTADFLSKKIKVNEGQIPQYYIEDDHEPIIEPAVFDMVQIELEKRCSGGGRYSGVSIFSSKIKCGQCGGWFGSKVWHSTDKYRKVIYRCNAKYGSKKCTTPHITENEIKAVFIKAVNLLLENRDEIVANVGMIRKAICNSSALESDRERLFDEMSMLSEMVQSLISENARVAINQDDYNKRFNLLSSQYDAAKQRYENVQRQIQELNVRSQQLQQFQRQLMTVDAITEFDEALWGTLVDFITINETEKIVTFRDGTEITV